MKSSLIQALDVAFVSKTLNPGVILFFSLFFFPFSLFALQHCPILGADAFCQYKSLFPTPFAMLEQMQFIYLKSSTSYHKKTLEGGRELKDGGGKKEKKKK